MSKDTDKKEQKYEPTEEMQKVLIAFCDMSVKPTVSARMDAANVGRTTWYEWIKDPRFLQWWKDETEAFMYRSISELNKIAFMKAGKDFRYMELLQTKYANYRKKTDVTSNDKPINDTGDIAKLLSEVLKDEGENRDTKEDGDGEARPEDGDISKEVSS